MGFVAFVSFAVFGLIAIHFFLDWLMGDD